MDGFYLFDYTHGADQTLQERLYTTASLMALKYGGPRDGYANYKEEYIREFWNYDAPYPTFNSFRKNVKVATIKWFIRNQIVLKRDRIWNADFLQGITQHGRVRWNIREYPTFYWQWNETILDLIKEAPFGGGIYSNKPAYRWVNVPALYLKSSEDSLSFIAGVLIGGQEHKKEGKIYAKYLIHIEPYLKKWGIPIEYYSPKKQYLLISPIWPALFSLWMPDKFKQKWLKIKKPAETEIYAPVLWKTYVNTNFHSKGIPYLRSRRAVYNDFQGEEVGVARKLEVLRVERNLTELDNRVKEAIWEWKNGIS